MTRERPKCDKCRKNYAFYDRNGWYICADCAIKELPPQEERKPRIYDPKR